MFLVGDTILLQKTVANQLIIYGFNGFSSTEPVKIYIAMVMILYLKLLYLAIHGNRFHTANYIIHIE